jgi:hypothetical protein
MDTKGNTPQVSVRIPTDIVRALDEQAREEERTRSQQIVFLLRQALAHRAEPSRSAAHG